MKKCRSCSGPLLNYSRYANCQRCRQDRRKHRKDPDARTRLPKRDITYDLSKLTAREMPMDTSFYCEHCGRATTLRNVRDRKHRCFATTDEDLSYA